jgi:hypothetical protein
MDAAQIDLREEPLALLPLVNLIEVVFGVVEGEDGVALPNLDFDQPAEPLESYPTLGLELVLPPILHDLLLLFLLTVLCNANL